MVCWLRRGPVALSAQQGCRAGSNAVLLVLLVAVLLVLLFHRGVGSGSCGGEEGIGRMAGKLSGKARRR